MSVEGNEFVCPHCQSTNLYWDKPQACGKYSHITGRLGCLDCNRWFTGLKVVYGELPPDDASRPKASRYKGVNDEQSFEKRCAEQDEFIRYIVEKVNPAREKAGLSQIREDEARTCFRVLKDFFSKLDGGE